MILTQQPCPPIAILLLLLFLLLLLPLFLTDTASAKTSHASENEFKEYIHVLGHFERRQMQPMMYPLSFDSRQNNPRHNININVIENMNENKEEEVYGSSQPEIHRHSEETHRSLTSDSEITEYWKEYESNKSDDDVTFRRKSTKKRHADLSDVWLPLGLALLWTIWVVHANMPLRLKKYTTDKATMVKGNVRETSIDPDGNRLMPGMPTYVAWVDYIVKLPSGNNVQVRKRFQTPRLMEMGFANVDILVLKNDPRSGMIKELWEKEYTQHKQQRWDYRLTSLFFGACMTFLCIVGAVHVVNQLTLDQRTWGWVSVVIGVTLLWPSAIIIVHLALRFNRTADPNAEILSGSEYLNDEDSKRLDLQEFCNPPGGYSQESSQQPSHGLKPPPAAEKNEYVTPTPKHSNRDPKRLGEMEMVDSQTAGCYVVGFHLHRGQSEADSSVVSSLSSVSIRSLHATNTGKSSEGPSSKADPPSNKTKEIDSDTTKVLV